MPESSYVDEAACSGCGSCAAICPEGIPYVQLDAGSGAGCAAFRPDRLGLCIGCGHCMALCPPSAIHVAGLEYGRDLVPLPDVPPLPDGFFDLIATRRATRVFLDRPVPRPLLERIVDAIAAAPPGFPPHKVRVTIVQDPEILAQANRLCMGTYRRLIDGMANPIARLMLRARMPAGVFASLATHVLPPMAARLVEIEAGQLDVITHGAPVLLLFHADRVAPSHRDDCLIAMTYGMLAAHALGLGTCPIGLIPPMVDRIPALRALFQVPPGDETLAALIAGYPRYHFRRGIRRPLAGVRWL